MRRRVVLGWVLGGVGLVGPLPCAGCDSDKAPASAPEAAPAASPPPAPPAPPDPPKAPDIVIDSSNVAVGSDRVATGEPALADKVLVFLKDRPMIAGNTVSVVAMRGARPSAVVAVVSALRKAQATGAFVRTESRDGATEKLPLTLPTAAPDCTTVAWIARDAAIDVWPAGGGTARRLVKGLAGPDMTLGTEAVIKQQSACASPVLYAGAEDNLSWGLVFDLATSAMKAPGARAGSAVLVTGAVPGRKLALQD